MLWYIVYRYRTMFYQTNSFALAEKRRLRRRVNAHSIIGNNMQKTVSNTFTFNYIILISTFIGFVLCYELGNDSRVRQTSIELQTQTIELLDSRLYYYICNNSKGFIYNTGYPLYKYTCRCKWLGPTWGQAKTHCHRKFRRPPTWTHRQIFWI